MKIEINGTSVELPDHAGAKELLEAVGATPDQTGVAIAINERVVPRSKWPEIQVRTGDRVEVVSAAQGG